ncbi:MAG: bifunctional ADP-dependent NAD(P)H-hydrate dehydratase/NAD(P)H-hydrate epimerase [Candidatus Anoxymicrobium japonicum]|uniref:Bifunctional NAD(P)H-hydrate repair enzyme n=1 Tax=Candidatus Anoxymicrobium japonicum TaxID=2013648 RepID=A0A2N3G4D7_9ACTN|nr:MAG: bifunctional ADP-dependent NAD(P)H-hydrate dehydratase/NAD(P)H-hydrate epimerase [Candidatus Anoxymicrobium japonicum]
MRVLLPSEMARIDRAAIEQEKIPAYELMERAGDAVARAARDMLTGAGGRRVAIICGKGNNGGDGLVAARRLSAAFDTVVYMVASSAPEELSDDSRANMERLSDTPVVVRWLSDTPDASELRRDAPAFDLLVDALFGTGFSGVASGIHAAAIEAMNDSGRPVLAVDIPSGVAGDTGVVSGPAVIAKRTVAFAAAKVGLVQFPGAGHVGMMDVVDIGIPDALLNAIPETCTFLMTEEDADALLPSRAPEGHKGISGSALVIGGSPGMTGAAAMCAQAALRAGAGVVTLAVPEGLSDILEIKLTEVMTVAVSQTDGRTFAVQAADELLEHSSAFDAVALGPGAGTAPETVDMIRRLVAGIKAPLVLDADGLNAMAGATEIFRDRAVALVVTPHPGEMARLLNVDTACVQADRIEVARRAAGDWGAVVVLKGAGTVIAGPGGDVFINPTGNAGMATAGTGDVLTGCVASFLAQGLGPFDAARAAAYFHGYSGDLVAQMEGMTGMTAGDVIRHLPLALRGLS